MKPIRFWTQNLRHDRSERCRLQLLNRRGSLHVGRGEVLAGQLVLGNHHCLTSIEVEADDDGRLGFLLVVAHLLFAHVSVPLPRWLRPDPGRNGRGTWGYQTTWKLRIGDGHLSWCVGLDDQHRSRDEGWRHASWSYMDWLFGKARYHHGQPTTVRVVVPLPERAYPATVDLYTDTWRCPRAPWLTKRVARADITPDEPIATPGKGESAWDIGDDATYSATMPAASAREAVVALVSSVLRDRERHGGSMQWQPAHAEGAGRP